MKFYAIFIFFTFEPICMVNCWDSEDLEVFDVVEEVGENFYTLLGVDQNAPASEIKKAFRRLSLVLHPDKNSAPDAEIKFRELASVYDILKDANKRSKYNDVLENGLPDWKQAIYYYRRVRKMGLVEMAVILFIIITIGQYLVAWAAYFEKKYTLEELVNIKSKKLQKRQKKGKPVDMETLNVLPGLVAGIPKPSVSCTLPVQIVRLVLFIIFEAPSLTYQWIKEYYKERKRRKEEEAMKLEESPEEGPIVHKERGPRRRKNFNYPELQNDENNTAECKSTSSNDKIKTNNETPNYASGGLWTDDDFVELLRLTKKFPAGCHERWERIGVAMRRPPNEVAHMAHRIKDEGFKPISQQTDEGEIKEEDAKKIKTKGVGKTVEESEENNWTQIQQKEFEQALAAYPKGTAADRWEKIAKCVHGKTKEECLIRYKDIAAYIKKKKDTASNNGIKCPPNESMSGEHLLPFATSDTNTQPSPTSGTITQPSPTSSKRIQEKWKKDAASDNGNKCPPNVSMSREPLWPLAPSDTNNQLPPQPSDTITQPSPTQSSKRIQEKRKKDTASNNGNKCPPNVSMSGGHLLPLAPPGTIANIVPTTAQLLPPTITNRTSFHGHLT